MRYLRSSFLHMICFFMSYATASEPSVEISESSYGLAAIDTANQEVLRPLLKDIVTNSDFFKYYRLDLFGRRCLFWDDEGMCGNRACAVDTIDDEEHLPEIWRSGYLGRLSAGSTIGLDEDLDKALGSGAEGSCVRDNEPNAPILPLKKANDYCVPEDESGDGPGVYVNLIDNPERYTGYSGQHANMIWSAIYTENCFPNSVPSNVATPRADPFSQIIKEGNWIVAREGGEQGRLALNQEDTCVEKRVFYKLISGMHASVSTHLSNEYLDTDTGEWGPNLKVFLERVGNFPDRIANVYFNFALVSKAVAKLRRYLEDFTFCTNAQGYDADTRRKMLKIAIEADRTVPDVFDSKKLFLEQPQLKEEFRTRFVNVSRIMDCTGCDKCRLWGKLQVTGYATALKILFELPEDGTGTDIQLRRMEMVALINTYDRLSKSIAAINMFRTLTSSDNEINNKEFDEVFEEINDPLLNQSAFEPVWDSEWRNVWEAVKYILRSYVEFPQNIWRLALYYANKTWTKFIGRDVILEKERLDRYMKSQFLAGQGGFQRNEL
ncbi:endoplasmic reticulum Oxidoreductin 1-domain-containing protein [Lipomyces japonicus]|uniref:endoplasmic reticulum Oxidoreductin 1-domain-containing protein n=1 Tax=Lipomyces japonicus TaxID=56871 RepID=UPI0034CFD785